MLFYRQLIHTYVCTYLLTDLQSRTYLQLSGRLHFVIKFGFSYLTRSATSPLLLTDHCRTMVFKELPR